MNKKFQERLNLKSKVAIVTGGSSGIGKKTAISLANYGVKVVVVNRNYEKGKRVINEIESNDGIAIQIEVDISKLSDVNNMVEKVMDRFGRIDILVNSAGISIKNNSVENIDEEEWDKTLNINLKGVFFCCQKVGMVMIKQKYGKIVNIGSLQGEQVLPLRAPYVASKGGLKQVTKSLAVEWAKYNINVNVVAPAFVKTPMTEKVLKNKHWKNIVINNTPMKRICEPQEVADAVIFLVSDVANYITGHTLIVDGGWTAGDAVDLQYVN